MVKPVWEERSHESFLSYAIGVIRRRPQIWDTHGSQISAVYAFKQMLDSIVPYMLPCKVDRFYAFFDVEMADLSQELLELQALEEKGMTFSYKKWSGRHLDHLVADCRVSLGMLLALMYRL